MKSFKEFINEQIALEAIPAKDIAQKHNVSIDVINAALDKGQKVELEHLFIKDKPTDVDYKEARRIASHHLNELPDYYEKLAKYVEPANENTRLIKTRL